jgi:ABC-type nickel/cobalt efflux system permease component RcnA
MTRFILAVLFAAFAAAFGGGGASAQQTAPGQEQAAPPRAAWPARPAAPAAQAAPQQQETGWTGWLLAVQQRLQAQLAASVRELKTGAFWSSAWALITLSFLYGVFHAAGPGHGKAVISSYVVANRTTARRGILLSLISSFVQALSAIGIVLVLALGLNAAGVEIRQAVRQFEIASAVLVILAGVWLLLIQLQRVWVAPRVMTAAMPGGHSVPIPDPHHHGSRDHHHHHAHAHGEDCGCGHAHIPSPRDLEKDWSLRHAAAIVLAVGIRPCTGAVLVLIFALTQGMFWAGVASTFAMSLGTAITVSALAVLAVSGRETAVRLAGNRWADRIYAGAGFAGASLVLLFGLLLLAGALSNTLPF